MSQRSLLMRNVSAEAGARVFYLATRFFIPPFVLGHIGLKAYGLYGAIFVLVAYFGMSAIGFSSAYIKYVATLTAKGEVESANRLLSSGFTLMSIVGCLGFAGFGLCWKYVAAWMKVPAPLYVDATFLSFLIVATFFAYLALSVYRDALTGLQEVAAVQRTWVGSVILETALIFALVGIGMGLRGLGMAFLARTAFEVGGNYYTLRRRAPWVRVRFTRPDRETLKLLFNFGGIVQVNAMLAIFLSSIERFIATPLIGLDAAGLLDLGKRLPGMAVSIPSAFASSVLPSAADLHGREVEDPRAEMRSLYLKTCRAMNAISGVLFAFLAFAALPSLVFWLGTVPANAAIITIAFAVSSQFHLLTGPGTSIAKASGRPRMEFHYSLANIGALLVLVPLSRVAFKQWSTQGVVLACGTATIVSAIWFLSRLHRALVVPLKSYSSEVLLPGLLPYVAAAVCLGPAAKWAAAGGRIHAGASLVIVGGMYLLLSGAGIYLFCATSSERQRLKRLASGLKGQVILNRWRGKRVQGDQISVEGTEGEIVQIA